MEIVLLVGAQSYRLAEDLVLWLEERIRATCLDETDDRTPPTRSPDCGLRTSSPEDAEAASRWQEFADVDERAWALLGQGRCLSAVGKPEAVAPLREARDLFANQPKITAILETLTDVGLGYIKLGQSAVTFSGGEAQRIKLARELAKRDTGRTLYILDEPTTGLHFQDIEMLLAVLQRLVDAGNSVVVIEHNLDVIKTADWLIDLGPEGGDQGGRIVAQGTPETVAQTKVSHTGGFLKKLLKR